MLEEPDELVCLAGRNRGGSRRHGGKRRFVGDRRRFDTPYDRRVDGYGPLRRDLVARINHPLTMVVLLWRCDANAAARRRLRHLGQPEGFLPLDVLQSVSLDISVVLGTTSMPVHQVLRLGRGAIIELQASEDDEVKILANNLPIASGLVVVNGNRIAVEVKEMLPRSPEVRDD